MSEASARFYDFAGFRLDGQARQLLQGGSPLPLAPKAVDVLLCLVRNRARVVSKDELLKAVWPDTVVEEGNLSQNISLLRKALGERQSSERLIVTVSGRGYRFAGDVIESNEPAPKLRPDARRYLAWAAAAVLAAALGFFLLRPAAPPAAARERQITTNSPELSITALALSPDGKSVAYADAAGIHLRFIASGETDVLPHPDGARIDRLSWFPDGSKLLASGAPAGDTRSHIWLVAPLAGGESAVRPLRADGAGAVVSPDGRRILFTAANDAQIWSMSAEGGEAALVLRGAQQDAFSDLIWFPDGARIAFARAPIVPADSIESCALPCTQPAVMVSSPGVLFARLLPSGRLVYGVGSWEPDRVSTALWEVPVSLTTGRAAGATHRVRVWSGLVLQVDHSADGTIGVALEGHPQHDVHIAELHDGGLALVNGHRLTLDDREDFLSGWTADSKTVLFTSNRSGNLEVYGQSPQQASARALFTSGRPKMQPTSSPDGAWLLYFDPPNWQARDWNSLARISRAPIAGGEPGTLLEEHGLYYFGCAAQRCVVGIMRADRIDLSELDPANGKGALLASLPASPDSNNYRYALSPDGRFIAATSLTSSDDGIELLSLADGARHPVRVAGWNQLHFIAWAPDGSGWYVSSEAAMASTLLHVDLSGRATPLLREPGRFTELPGEPSPDGRYLAYSRLNPGNNIWLMDGF